MTMDWMEAAFGGSQMSTGQECARAALIFLYGLALVRLAGRRVFGKWAALDIIVSIIIGSNLSRALTGAAPLVGTLAATALLLALHWLFAHAASRSRGVSRVVEGRSVELARDGALDDGARRRWAVSEADLHEALRQSGLEKVEESRLLVLEPSGKISVLGKPG
jgi:uncharacterized membrane protein YcaP (DUF421 family)